MNPESAAREEILGRVHASLDHETGRGGLTLPAPAVPSTARIPSRAAGDPASEMDLLLREIGEIGGHVRRFTSAADPAAAGESSKKGGSMAAAVQSTAGLVDALAELIEIEKVTRAAMWQTPDLRALGLAEMLASLGVEVAPPGASPAQIATCELGITGVDAVLPETGTLLLSSGADRPRTVSLLPRVHLAILTAQAWRGSLAEVLSQFRDASGVTLVTGPSRTSDIELTLTIGVHGPKALYVWVL
jgi:L-lactate dehydrogenase complex protein LldG